MSVQISWERAFARLSALPLDARTIAQAFALATGAERVVYFPAVQDGMALEGIDTRGATIARFQPSAFDFKTETIGKGRDGLCPLADRDPGTWLAVRLGEKAGGIAIVRAPAIPGGTFQAFCRVAVARIVTDAEKRAAQARAERDPLTGLLNRDGLVAAIGNRPRYVVISLDSNGLKKINDSQGHAAGDLYLQTTAHALQEAVRSDDPVARIGGDEFVVIGTSSDTVDRVRRSLAAATWIDQNGMVAPVSASIGVATVPDDAPGLTEALLIADKAMYDEKHAYHDVHGGR
jgi:diguanylate cyclase (GGDEF)-like protein